MMNNLNIPQLQHCEETFLMQITCIETTPVEVIRTVYLHVAWEFGWPRICSNIASFADKYCRYVQIHTCSPIWVST